MATIVVIFSFTLPSVSASSGAEQGSGPGGPVLAVNPYADVDWARFKQIKVNLHTHTTESDGRLSPAQVVDEYRARGYHGLALTDHNRNTWPWTAFDRDPEAVGMLAIAGNELSRHHHALSLFSSYETPESDLDAVLKGVANADGLAILCHPAMHWVPQHSVASGLSVPLTPPLRRIAKGDFTVETWFRTTNAGRSILMGNYSGGYRGALNLELHTDNRVRVYVQPADGATVDLNVSASTLGIDTRDGQWHHLAGIRRAEEVLLYLDGRLAGQRADDAGTYELQGDRYFIGRDSRTGSTVLNGDLCRVRLWRRALSHEELAAVVSGDAISPDGLLAQYASPIASGSAQAAYPDTSGNPDGPLDAEADGIAPEVISDGPDVLDSDAGWAAALRFTPAGFPTSVSDEAFEWYLDVFRRHRELVGIEVLNRTRPDREYPLDRELWDRLLATLMPHRPVWGVAVDDMHGMQHMGGDWVVLLAPQAGERMARRSLSTGRYYFASTRLHDPSVASVEGTPRIERIVHDEPTGRIVVTATVTGEPVPDSACVWISDGRIVHTGLALPYRTVAGIGTYVRAEITGAGGTAFTNPFGLLPARHAANHP